MFDNTKLANTTCRYALIPLLLVCLVAIPASSMAAGPKSDSLYPQSTVGFLTIDNMVDCRARWNRTQLGQFCDDPTMQPFMDQLRDKMAERMGDTKERLGITMEELSDVATGEVSIGLVPAVKEDDEAVVVMLADVTGKGTEAQALVDKISTNLEKDGAVLDKEASTNELNVYQVPKTKKLAAHTAAYFIKSNRLGVADNQAVAMELMDHLDQPEPQVSLSASANYKATLAKSRKAANGILPTVVWYMDPFAYSTAKATRKTLVIDDATDNAAAEEAVTDEKDTLQTLREEGFEAVLGLGGFIVIAPDQQRDFIHYTTIYAPPKPGTEGKSAAERYDGAMRMFELPNSKASATGEEGLEIQAWAPRDVASYKTLHIDILNAFDHVDSLFDAMAGYENAFQTTLDGFEKDPFGPKIKLRDQLIANLGKRVTVVTDYTLPVTADCERYLIVFDGCNEEELRKPLDKLMKSDGALLRELNGISYWETVPEEVIDDLDEGLLPFDEPIDEDREPADDSKSAVCLNGGQLIMSSDVEFLEKALFGVKTEESLSTTLDLKLAFEQINQLVPGDRCAWTFSRLDESLRPSYELLRAGKMPQSNTFFGRMLNRMLTTEEQKDAGEDRAQKVDGTKLPSFEIARRYFGPSARIARTDDDGWVLVGVVINKSVE